jgi:hypothetical protein
MRIFGLIISIQFLLFCTYKVVDIGAEVLCQEGQKRYLNQLFFHEIYGGSKLKREKLRRCKNKMEIISTNRFIRLNIGKSNLNFNVSKLKKLKL